MKKFGFVFFLSFLCIQITVFAQSNFLIELDGPMVLDSNSSDIYFYKIPLDSVKAYKNRGYQNIHPQTSEEWLQKPVYVVSKQDIYKFYSSNKMLPGYYLSLSAVRGKILFDIKIVEGFDAQIRSLGLVKLVDVKDFEGKVLSDVIVRATGKIVPFDPVLQAYVIQHNVEASIEVEVESKDFISFWQVHRYKEYNYVRNPVVKKKIAKPKKKHKKKSKKTKDDEDDDDEEEDEEEEENYTNNRYDYDDEDDRLKKIDKQKVLRGYLVTNKPKYLPGDTIRFKAWIENGEHHPVKTPMKISLKVDGYVKHFLYNNFKASAPGLYFGEYIIGDSIRLDRNYQLCISSQDLYVNDLCQQIKIEDYVLDEKQFNPEIYLQDEDAPIPKPDLSIKLKSMDIEEFQWGDTVDLFAYIGSSNKLPINKGYYVRTITAKIKYGTNAKVGIYPYDITLAIDTIEVNPSGETDLSFATNKLPKVGWDLHCQAKFVHPEFGEKITFKKVSLSEKPYLIKKEINGNTIKVSIIKNKKEVVGYKGKYSVYWGHNGDGYKDKVCSFPFSYTIGSTERIYIEAEGLDRVSFFEQRTATLPEIYYEIRGDTVIVQIENTKNIQLRMAVYMGKDLLQLLSVNSDTVLKFANPKRQTITLKGCQSFGAEVINHRIFSWPKELDLLIQNKEFAYPGQKDTIRLQLSTKDKSKLPRTNVTVLAFNGDFKEDFVPEILAENSIDYGLDAVAIQERVEKNISLYRYLLPIPTTMEWLKKCAADTMFFYKNLCVLEDGIRVLRFDNPNNPKRAEVAVYIRDSNSFYLPEIVHYNYHPLYINGVNTVSPYGYWVPAEAIEYHRYSGDNKLTIRTNKASYTIGGISLWAGKKTIIIINADTCTTAYLPWEKRTTAVRKANPSLPFISTQNLPDSLSEEERKRLVNFLGVFGTEEATYAGKVGLFQYPVSIYPNQFLFQNREERSNKNGLQIHFIVGPIRQDYPLCFWENKYNKACFEWQKDYSYTLNFGKISKQHFDTEEWLKNLKLSARQLLPKTDTLLPSPDNWQQIVAREDSLMQAPDIKYKTEKKLRIIKRYERNKNGVSITLYSGRINKKYSIIYKEGDSSSVLIYNDGMGFHLYTGPGKYKILVIDNNNEQYEIDNVEINNKEHYYVYIDSTVRKGKFDYDHPPATLKYFVQENKVALFRDIGLWKRGDISGKITDSLGKVLPGVIVKLYKRQEIRAYTSAYRYRSGKQIDETNTDNEGNYSFKNLLLQDYDLGFQLTGYITHRSFVVSVNLDQNTKVNRFLVPFSFDDKRIITEDTSEKLKQEIVKDREARSKRGDYVEHRSLMNLSSSSPSISSNGIERFDSKNFEKNYSKKYKMNSELGNASENASKERRKKAETEDETLIQQKVQSFITELMNNPMSVSGIRKNFRDWAIWEPNLWTDKNGKTSFNVTYPDNITSWKTYVLAMNTKGYTIKTMRITRAFKAISAELSAPRFLRYGDKVELVGKASNLSKEKIVAGRHWTVDGISVNADSGILQYTKSDFKLISAPLNSHSLDTQTIKAAYTLEMTNGYKDGEEREIPIYPIGVQESFGESFLLLQDSSIHTTKAKEIEGYKYLKTNVFIDGSILEVMLRQLEELKEYPHGCVEQLTTKLMAINYEEKVKKLIKGAVPNNTKAKAEIINKIVAAHNSNGSFGWWQYGNSDIRITNYVVNALVDANIDAKLNNIVRLSCQYLRAQLNNLNHDDKIITLRTLAKNNFIDNLSGAAILKNLDNGSNQPLYNQLVMLELKQQFKMPFKKELDSIAVLAYFQNIADNANAFHKEDDYFQYDWYRNNTAIDLIAYKMFKEDSAHKALAEKLKQKLLFPKKLARNNTANSSMIFQTFIPEYLNGKQQIERKDILGKVYIDASWQDSFTNFPAYRTIRGKNENINFRKTGIATNYVSVVHDYFNTKPQPTDSGFTVSTCFLNQKGDTLHTLPQGEKVIMRVNVVVKKQSTYFMLDAPIPAGCIPQNNTQSRYNSYHGDSRETFKDRVCIFKDFLYPGNYKFDIILDCRFKGVFNLNPTRACLMYFPNVYGINEIKTVMIK